MTFLSRAFAMAVALTCASAIPAAGAGLNTGDIAPPLSISEWVKGASVDLKKDGSKKIHVVEFWAVWCPPCKMSVPLLTKLQKRFSKDVTILGITEPDFGRNSPASIRRFVKSQGSEMEYTVGIDTGRTTQAYMAAAGVEGIPHAFVVGKDGRIAWQGSPLDPALETVLEELVAGRFDMAAVKLEQQVMQRLDELQLLFQMEQWDRVWDGLLEILKLDPSSEVALGVLTRISVEQLRNADQFRSFARNHIDKHRTNPDAMSRLAMILSNITDLSSRLPDLALEAAKAAYDSSKQRDAVVTSIYARALYQVGAMERAIALQQDAVALATPEIKVQLQDIVAYYRLCKKVQVGLN